MQRDSIQNVIVVSLGVCLVCSILVSGMAVGLRPLQKENQKLEIQKNILIAAGLWNGDENKATSGEGTIPEVFAQVEQKLVDLDTGNVVTADDVDFDVETYKPRKAEKIPELSKVLSEGDIAGIKTREQYTFVYEVKGEGESVDQYVLPIRGYGLWSTLRGFISLDKDLRTIRGLTFYEHKETPGLGGEVDSKKFKEQWPGKFAFDESGEIIIEVLKGSVPPNDPGADHKIDGLSGATITTKGIDNMLQYWLGSDGFGPFLAQLKTKGDK